jgi:hypothetical protein
VAIATIGAVPIYKRSMDTAPTRKRESPGTISRGVGVTRIRILRSGVTRKSRAPFWNSGRRIAPPLDCHCVHLTIRQHVAAVGRRVMTLCKHEAGVRQQLALYHSYDNFCLPHTSLCLPLPQPLHMCL